MTHYRYALYNLVILNNSTPFVQSCVAEWSGPKLQSVSLSASTRPVSCACSDDGRVDHDGLRRRRWAYTASTLSLHTYTPIITHLHRPGDVSMVRRPIVLYDDPLVRKLIGPNTHCIGPKTHWCINPLVRRPIGPKKSHWSKNGGTCPKWR